MVSLTRFLLLALRNHQSRQQQIEVVIVQKIPYLSLGRAPDRRAGIGQAAA
jgi:hypothetical protein